MDAIDYRGTIDALADALHVVDRKLKIILCNPALRRLNEAHGLVTDVVGKKLTRVYPFLDQKVLDEYRQVFETGEVLVAEEETVVDGERVYTVTRKIPVVEKGAVQKVVTIIQDVTAFRDAEEKAREAAETWRETFNSIQDGICILDSEGHVLKCNAAVVEWSGRPADRIAGLPCWQVLPLEDADIKQCPFVRMKASRRSESREVHWDGRTTEITVDPVFDEGGDLVRAVFVMRDITARKDAEHSLHELNRRLETLIQEMPDVVYFKDATGRYVIVNRAFEAYSGKPASEVLGKTDADLVEPGIAEQCLRSDHAVWASRAAGTSLEQWPDPAGRIVYYATHKAPIFDEDGELRGLVGISRDVTDIKEQEAALKARGQALARSEASLNSIVDKSPTPMLLSDADGTIVRMNDACRDLLVPEADRGPGRYSILSDPILKQKGLHPQLRRVYERGDTVRFTVDYDARAPHEFTLPVREPRILDMTVSAVTDDNGRVLNAICQFLDITEHHHAEEERRRMEVHLRHQQKLDSLGTLAAGVASEIIGPIDRIGSAARRITGMPPAPAAVLTHAGEIAVEAERVGRIVRSLVSFGQRTPADYGATRADELVEDTLILVRSDLLRDQVEPAVEVPDDLPAFRCRKEDIKHALLNLLSNAHDALNARFIGHDPDKVLLVRACRFDRGRERWIRLTVEDNGGGIPDEIRERIFDPFFTTKSREDNPGLGLTISRNIVHEHHGEICVESQPGKFTRMHIDLPVESVPT